MARVFYKELGIVTTVLDGWDEDEVQKWFTIIEVVTNFEAKMAERERALAEHKAGG